MKARNLNETIPGTVMIVVLLLALLAPTHGLLSPMKQGNLTDSATAQFLRKALIYNRMEIQLALMGSKRAESMEVKNFAKKLLQYHEELNLKLRRLAAERKVMAKDELDEECKDHLDKIIRLRGALFERKYLGASEKNHKESLVIYKEAIEKSGDVNVKAFAATIIPFLETHNASLALLSKSVKQTSKL
jgi:putative membrane protein